MVCPSVELCFFGTLTRRGVVAVHIIDGDECLLEICSPVPSLRMSSLPCLLCAVDDCQQNLTFLRYFCLCHHNQPH